MLTLIQDKSDDLLIGIKSTALKFEDTTRYWLTGFASIMFSSLFAVGVNTNQAWPFYLSVLASGAHITRQVSFL